MLAWPSAAKSPLTVPVGPSRADDRQLLLHLADAVGQQHVPRVDRVGQRHAVAQDRQRRHERRRADGRGQHDLEQRIRIACATMRDIASFPGCATGRRPMARLTHEKVAFARGARQRKRLVPKYRLSRLPRVAWHCAPYRTRRAGQCPRCYCTNALPVTCGTVTVRVRSGACTRDRVRGQRLARERELHVGRAGGGDGHVRRARRARRRPASCWRPDRRYSAVLRGVAADKREPQQVVVARGDGPPAGLRAIERQPAGKPLRADVGHRRRSHSASTAITPKQADDDDDGGQLQKRHGTARCRAPCHGCCRVERLVARLDADSSSADPAVHASSCTRCVVALSVYGAAVHRVGRNAVREVVGVGADVRQVVRRPCALFDVPALDGRVDRGLVVGVDLLPWPCRWKP